VVPIQAYHFTKQMRITQLEYCNYCLLMWKVKIESEFKMRSLDTRFNRRLGMKDEKAIRNVCVYIELILKG